MATYKHLTVEDLKAECRKRGLKGYSSKNRRGLIAMLNLSSRGKKKRKPAAKRKPATRARRPKRKARRGTKAAAKKMFDGLSKKINARSGAWVSRKKALYKKALLALARKGKIKIKPAIKKKMQAAVKRSKY